MPVETNLTAMRTRALPPPAEAATCCPPTSPSWTTRPATTTPPTSRTWRPTALIRVRGNSSRYFDKKSYLLRFTEDDGSYADHEVMGMDAHYEWALHGPYLDKSLIRNYMWYNIAGEIMDYAPNVRFCEVILNGEYQGLYVMVETITNGDGLPGERLRAHRQHQRHRLCAPPGPGQRERDEKPGQLYLLHLSVSTGTTATASISSTPNPASLTQELADAIEQEFSDFEKALYSYDYDTHDYGYQNYIDVDSFVDYFIINEFTQNYDAG